MNLSYCNNKCPAGIAARNKFLKENNSAFDAATDFRFFVKKCLKTCPNKIEVLKNKEPNGENI